MNDRRGALFIVSGPSGSGKTSLCAALLKQCPELRLSISATTRDPRPGEEHGKNYFFLSPEEFESEKQADAFLECALVHGHWYGTRAADVESLRANGFDVLLEIDWQGAKQVAEKCPDAHRIFILPPSMDTLRQRLVARGQDDAGVIEFRVKAAVDEIAHAGDAGFRIVNNQFDDALRELLAIYHEHRNPSPVC
ncbi:MAG: guanylate kinase [Zetaproteobacteria bacterium]|nr:MAG: guanylate kinase [Zetaproteobacteria bacterium]